MGLPARAPSTDAPVAGATTEAITELTIRSQQWLDAYYRQDAALIKAMATSDMKISDERSAEERLPPGLPNVRRALERVTCQFVGESAVFSARMTEQGNTAGESMPYRSWVSEIWIREAGQWKLMGVRLLDDTQLK